MPKPQNIDILDVFAERLVQARKERNFTQQEFASAINVAASTLSAYENLNQLQSEKGNNTDKIARKTPNIYTAYSIAKELNISLDWLCGLSPHKNNDVTILHAIADMLETEGMACKVLKDASEIEENEEGELTKYGKIYKVAIGTDDTRIYDFIREYENVLNVIKVAQNVSDEYEFPPDVAMNMKISVLNKHRKILGGEQGDAENE